MSRPIDSLFAPHPRQGAVFRLLMLTMLMLVAMALLAFPAFGCAGSGQWAAFDGVEGEGSYDVEAQRLDIETSAFGVVAGHRVAIIGRGGTVIGEGGEYSVCFDAGPVNIGELIDGLDEHGCLTGTFEAVIRGREPDPSSSSPTTSASNPSSTATSHADPRTALAGPTSIPTVTQPALNFPNSVEVRPQIE